MIWLCYFVAVGLFLFCFLVCFCVLFLGCCFGAFGFGFGFVVLLCLVLVWFGVWCLVCFVAGFWFFGVWFVCYVFVLVLFGWFWDFFSLFCLDLVWFGLSLFFVLCVMSFICCGLLHCRRAYCFLSLDCSFVYFLCGFSVC